MYRLAFAVWMLFLLFGFLGLVGDLKEPGQFDIAEVSRAYMLLAATAALAWLAAKEKRR